MSWGWSQWSMYWTEILKIINTMVIGCALFSSLVVLFLGNMQIGRKCMVLLSIYLWLLKCAYTYSRTPSKVADIRIWLIATLSRKWQSYSWLYEKCLFTTSLMLSRNNRSNFHVNVMYRVLKESLGTIIGFPCLSRYDL